MSTSIRADNSHASRRRFARLAASILLTLGAFATAPAHAQQVEIAYSTFLDPNNKADPRAAAQTRMIEAFEKANPNIKVKVIIDPTQSASSRAFRSKSESPDIARFANWSISEIVATGSVLQLDDLLKRDNVSETDWLIPLAQTKVGGKIYGMQQDYRIPVLLYRKSLLDKAGVTPPKTWDEACVAGGKLNKDGVTGYAVPLGSSGGVGGAQALAENLFSSMVTESGGGYFGDDGRAFQAPREAVIRSLQTIRDMYGKCRATPPTNAQFGYSETHDGLRAGTIAQGTFGLFRFRAIQSGGAGDDLAWAPPPAFAPAGKMVTYGFQIVVNANSPRREAAWAFTKFMTGPEAQAIAAEGGEVVSRASTYQAPYFKQPEAANQLAWAELIRSRGKMVNYSVISSTFNQILGDAAVRMILRNATAEDAYTEIVAKYDEALKKAQ